jgi:hypothetical protein
VVFNPHLTSGGNKMSSAPATNRRVVPTALTTGDLSPLPKATILAMRVSHGIIQQGKVTEFPKTTTRRRDVGFGHKAMDGKSGLRKVTRCGFVSCATIAPA